MGSDLVLTIALLFVALIVLGLMFAGIVPIRALRKSLIDPIEQMTGDLNRLSRDMPSTAVVDGVRQTSEALSQSLTAHDKALQHQSQVVVTLPELVGKQVAGEVREGLAPVKQSLDRLATTTEKRLAGLTDEIGKTHGHLVNALHTVDSAGGLSEWTASFREAIEPLQAVSASLETHFGVARDLLRTGSEQAMSVAGLREVTEQAFARITKAVEHWESIESANIQALREEVGQRLTKLEEAIVRVGESIAPLEVANQNLVAANTAVQEVVQESMVGMRNLQGHTRDLLDTHRKNATALIEKQQELQRIQRVFQDDIRQVEQSHEAHTQRFSEELQSMTESMTGFRAEHSEVLKAMERQRDEMIQWMQRVKEQESDLLARADAQLEERIDRLPTRQGQILANVFQGLQLGLIVALVIYVVLFAR